MYFTDLGHMLACVGDITLCIGLNVETLHTYFKDFTQSLFHQVYTH